MLMLNAQSISTEIEFAGVLSRCGYPSKPPQASSAWKEWREQWNREQQKRRAWRMPMARYLSGIADRVFIVAIHKDAFQIYEQTHTGIGLILISELRGDITEQEFCTTLNLATSPPGEGNEISVTEAACLCLD